MQRYNFSILTESYPLSHFSATHKRKRCFRIYSLAVNLLASLWRKATEFVKLISCITEHLLSAEEKNFMYMLSHVYGSVTKNNGFWIY
jgi:hypothetical protein